jgi:hypothetical protein
MFEICSQIAALFHWRITYEDPPVFNKNELVLEIAPSGIPVHRMRGLPVSLDLPAKQNETLTEYRRKVMDAAITAYAGSGNRAAFRFSDDGEYISVTPNAVSQADGKLQPFESILNAPVTIPRGQYTVRGILQATLDQVAGRIGIPISLGTLPRSFMQITVTEEAANESARDVIVRVFYEQNGQRYKAGVPPERLFWQITCMAEGPLYFFNAGSVAPDLDPEEITRRSRIGAAPPKGAELGGTAPKAGFATTPK